MIRVELPYHLRQLARISGNGIEVEVDGAVTMGRVIDAIEARYPMLQGTIRDHATGKRRPLLRFFACEEDISFTPLDERLPDAVASGREPVIVLGAIAGGSGHAGWVRLSHWIAAIAIAVLVGSGVTILMVHPRLYWGEAGNDLTPPWIELKISRNYKHGGWTAPSPFFDSANGPVSANRTYDIFNQNGWARSLHFLSAWFLVATGVLYLINGLMGGHFRAHIWPRRAELSRAHLWKDVRDHLRLRIPAASGGPRYAVLQKLSYALVIFVAAPLLVASGLTMAPAVTAAWPVLLRIFGGYQSARTMHFLATVAIVAFVAVHVAMVFLSGFRRQMRGMTFGR